MAQVGPPLSLFNRGDAFAGLPATGRLEPAPISSASAGSVLPRRELSSGLAEDARMRSEAGRGRVEARAGTYQQLFYAEKRAATKP